MVIALGVSCNVFIDFTSAETHTYIVLWNELAYCQHFVALILIILEQRKSGIEPLK